MFKAILMASFPPIDALDNTLKVAMDAADLRTSMLSYMMTLDKHIETVTDTTASLYAATAVAKEECAPQEAETEVKKHVDRRCAMLSRAANPLLCNRGE